MYRAIITPKETTLTIELPEQMVGKPVEVLAFEIEKNGDSISLTSGKRKRTFEEAIALWDSMAVDMSNFKFNREEANER
ncbi:MAG: hypothetical protein K2U26_14940 [Cyclobacteriaceae bacterium]|nr:hypothetical protein [Cyclobacteriaceae bacterium]